MKKSRLSYDEWKCIVSKEMYGKKVDTEFIKGFIGLIEIKEVSEKQIWKFNGVEITVCDKGMKWLSILPQDDFYCITAMMNERNDILVWYIDMIAEQGIDKDGVPYFKDLYLDLIVYPDGRIIVDDMDELEEALIQKDITQEQFNLAINTSEELKTGLLKDTNVFLEYSQKCYEIIKNC
ncbi:DUF402 domain-containing protein [Clostridium boliviensis]|uniref:DUF402 domain-containing protein n=1 Tax=Clostridium boliviensis TaxID=318465 RepID=A0ABU4GH06_9CLOT|nr:DUF402 domain-containing protein [Clostridium boliviensis]MDW2796896.1 DUF402 domain-containing protein [Clostridium boliviensis]